MKIKYENPVISFTCRLRQDLLNRLEDELRKHPKLSRNDLIDAILRQALEHQDFTVKVEK